MIYPVFQDMLNSFLLPCDAGRRHLPQTTQLGGGACVELGRYEFEGELERLKRDRKV
jgi:hypothetical protein